MADFSDPEFDEAIKAAGLTFHRHPLSWYVDKLRMGEHFSLARYGDGELACMLGRKGRNTDGCEYLPELGHDLRYYLSSTKPGILYGMQRVLPEDVARFRTVRDPSLPWVDSEVFGRSLLNGEMYPFIDALRGRATVLVTNTKVGKEAMKILGSWKLIETPESNSYLHRNRIFRDILKAVGDHRCALLFGCGMTAKVLIGMLHGLPKVSDSWLIDVGHLWDVFAGVLSREELKSLSQETIRRNLRG